MSTVDSTVSPITDFAAVKVRQQATWAGLLRELTTLIESRDRSGDTTFVLPGEYLEVVVERS